MRFLATVKGIDEVEWDRDVPALLPPTGGINEEQTKLLHFLCTEAQKTLPMMTIQAKKMAVTDVQARGGPYTCIACGKGTMLAVSHPGFHPSAPGGPTWIDQMVPSCFDDACQRRAEDFFFSANKDLTGKPDSEGPTFHKCAACGGPGTVKCARCKGAHYCGPACQKDHWATHKPACVAPTPASAAATAAPKTPE